MDFSTALAWLRAGKKLSRSGWNGKNLFVYLVDGSQFTVNRPPLNSIYPEGTVINYAPHIDIATPEGSCSVWAPSMGDVLAYDWEIVELEEKTVNA